MNSLNKKNDHAGTFAIIAILSVLPLAAWFGFVVKTLWGWFVVPLGVTPLSLWGAAGIFLLVRLFFFDQNAMLSANDKRSSVEKMVAGLINSILTPAVVLLFAALYHSFA